MGPYDHIPDPTELPGPFDLSEVEEKYDELKELQDEERRFEEKFS